MDGYNFLFLPFLLIVSGPQRAQRASPVICPDPSRCRPEWFAGFAFPWSPQALHRKCEPEATTAQEARGAHKKWSFYWPGSEAWEIM
ncbi:hypothetical protein N7489_003589 [Penicillium chrysogenum]|uniref:Secreted protein n=1 Tax=Penicillium chrysogenum TaxID=5076 RepID=A0ABQ8WA23_PENCH|nr:uncharacterized protein N7489_003589 [Penicillium chrysogenum]KAJ5253179.1 hypothetical protein N7489_003589 [Penicillium chrysogenum]KAJ5260401.1 hypothetical protein N7505_009782 [Penicillium chrysogenum]KAJ6137012.1 hypothetical protein N7497_012264 [Penicillium chrysogenum]